MLIQFLEVMLLHCCNILKQNNCGMCFSFIKHVSFHEAVKSRTTRAGHVTQLSMDMSGVGCVCVYVECEVDVLWAVETHRAGKNPLHQCYSRLAFPEDRA